MEEDGNFLARLTQSQQTVSGSKQTFLFCAIQIITAARRACQFLFARKMQLF